MRYSIGGALVAIALFAVACAGMTHRTPLWTAAAVSLTLLLIAIMVARAVGLHGEPRAFATTFVVVCGGYLLLATTTGFRVQALLVTNYPMALAARVVEVPPIGQVPANGGGFFSVPEDVNVSLGTIGQFGSGRRSPPSESLESIVDMATSDAPYSVELQRFFLIGHCVWSWCFGVTFGLFAAHLYRKDRASRGAPQIATDPAQRPA